MQNSEQMLVGLLANLGPGMRNIAADALVVVSEPLIPTLKAALESENPQVRKMAAVALCRINPAQFMDVIRDYMERDILALHANNVRALMLESCVTYPSVAMLQKTIREQNELMSAELFYLLGAVYDAESMEKVRANLDSGDHAAWQRAVKELETLTTPQMAVYIGEMFDHTLTPERILKISSERSGLRPDTHDVLVGLAQDSSNPTLKAMAIYALGGIFAIHVEKPLSDIESSVRRAKDMKPADFHGQVTPQIASEDEPTAHIKTSEVHRKPSGLLDSLMGGDADRDSTRKLERPVGNATNNAPKPNPCQEIFTRQEVEALINDALKDQDEEVRTAARAARRMLDGKATLDVTSSANEPIMPMVERMILLSNVLFFQGLSAQSLQLLAKVATEVHYPENTVIVNEGEVGNTLYVVAEGRVRLERAGQRQDTSALLDTLESGGTFGELTIFDSSPRITTALTGQPTLVLKIEKESLLTMVRQYPELSLQLITVLTQRIRFLEEKIADRTPSKSRMIHKIYDKLD